MLALGELRAAMVEFNARKRRRRRPALEAARANDRARH